MSEILQKQGQRFYNNLVNTYTTSKNITVDKKCTGYMFTNLGDTVAFVNGMRVNPSPTPATSLGDSRSILLHQMDLYRGNMELSFLQPIGANPLVEIVQLVYMVDDN